MRRITVVANSVKSAEDLKVQLGRYFQTECIHLDELTTASPGEFTFVDVNLKDSAKLPSLMRWLTRRPTSGQVIFGVDQRSHFEFTQAYAIGATGLMPRPVDGVRLAMMLSAGRGRLPRIPPSLQATLATASLPASMACRKCLRP